VSHQLDALVADIQQGKEANLQEAVQVMVGFMVLARQKDYQIEALENKVNTMEKEIIFLKRQLNKPDILLARRGLVVRGFQETKDGNGSDEGNFKDFLKKGLNIKEDLVESVKRVPLSQIMKEKLQKEKKAEIRPLLVRFKEVQGKYTLFKNIHKLQNVPNGGELRISNDIPLCLKAKNAGLEEEGRKIRNQDKNIRTRVVFEGLDIKLQAKKKSEDRWTDCTM